MHFRKTKFFLPLILVLVILSYFLLQSAPSYTRWAVILLILPSIFFLFRAESKIEYRKIFIISVIGIILGLVWDHVAIDLQIWDFPKESVIGWFLGIPIEEYIFAVCFCIIVIGIYTSLPKFKYHISDGPRLRELPLLGLVFSSQIIVLTLFFYSNAQSYFKWLLFLAILPSIFYLWRKGEKIDEVRMFLTAAILVVATLVVDVIFINSQSWFHYNDALLGRIGVVPIDDILFSVFTGVSIIGLYTSLPKNHMLTGKW